MIFYAKKKIANVVRLNFSYSIPKKKVKREACFIEKGYVGQNETFILP